MVYELLSFLGGTVRNPEKPINDVKIRPTGPLGHQSPGISALDGVDFGTAFLGALAASKKVPACGCIQNLPNVSPLTKDFIRPAR